MSSTYVSLSNARINNSSTTRYWSNIFIDKKVLWLSFSTSCLTTSHSVSNCPPWFRRGQIDDALLLLQVRHVLQSVNQCVTHCHARSIHFEDPDVFCPRAYLSRRDFFCLPPVVLSFIHIKQTNALSLQIDLLSVLFRDLLMKSSIGNRLQCRTTKSKRQLQCLRQEIYAWNSFCS